MLQTLSRNQWCRFSLPLGLWSTWGTWLWHASWQGAAGGFTSGWRMGGLSTPAPPTPSLFRTTAFISLQWPKKTLGITVAWWRTLSVRWKATSLCLPYSVSFYNVNIFICPWRRKWQPTPVFLPGKFYGARSLVGPGLWCHTSQTCLIDWVFSWEVFSRVVTESLNAVRFSPLL